LNPDNPRALRESHVSAGLRFRVRGARRDKNFWNSDAVICESMVCPKTWRIQARFHHGSGSALPVRRQGLSGPDPDQCSRCHQSECLSKSSWWPVRSQPSLRVKIPEPPEAQLVPQPLARQRCSPRELFLGPGSIRSRGEGQGARDARRRGRRWGREPWFLPRRCPTYRCQYD
jgi:hypothetical protein